MPCCVLWSCATRCYVKIIIPRPPGQHSKLYYTILLNYTILYYTILYYTILYYTILYYTILYYTILYYNKLYIPQRGVQWKQGVVVCMMLYTILLYSTTPIHCTPLPLHPPVMNTHYAMIRKEQVCIYIYIYIYVYTYIYIYVYA